MTPNTREKYYYPQKEGIRETLNVLTVMSLTEDDSIERSIENNINLDLFIMKIVRLID